MFIFITPKRKNESLSISVHLKILYLQVYSVQLTMKFLPIYATAEIAASKLVPIHKAIILLKLPTIYAYKTAYYAFEHCSKIKPSYILRMLKIMLSY